jgi:hypothetical protein
MAGTARAGKRSLAAAAIVASFLIAGPASASQTIGQVPDLPASYTSCTDDEAYVQLTVAALAPYSPSSYGVITSWSARSKNGPGQTVKLMVFRDLGSDQFAVVARDNVTRTLSPVQDTLNTFATRVPIEADQRIGIYQPPGSTESCEFGTGVSADHAGFSVPFGVGEPPDNVSFDYSNFDDQDRVNVLAVVEPDADRDVFGDESQDKCVGTAGTASGCPSTVSIAKVKQKGAKKVKVTVDVPGAGTAEIGSAGPKTVKAKQVTVTATTRQLLSLTLELTKSARSQLTDRGKLKLKLRALYTPPGGSPGSATKKQKLKA